MLLACLLLSSFNLYLLKLMASFLCKLNVNQFNYHQCDSDFSVSSNASVDFFYSFIYLFCFVLLFSRFSTTRLKTLSGKLRTSGPNRSNTLGSSKYSFLWWRSVKDDFSRP